MKEMDIPFAYKRSVIPVFLEIPCHGGERDGKSSKATSNQ